MPQLENEIKILASCDHPNIIALKTVFEDPKYIYMIMELAQDGTLFNKIKQHTKLTEADVAHYMI